MFSKVAKCRASQLVNEHFVFPDKQDHVLCTAQRRRHASQARVLQHQERLGEQATAQIEANYLPEDML